MVNFTDSGGIYLASDPTVGVRFQLWPATIEDSKSVNWSGIEVIGRSEPIQTYHSSNAQQFAFELMFVASLDGSDNGTPIKAKKKIDFLKSLTYPVKAPQGYVTFPPVVYLVVGNLINTRCIVQSVKSDWSGPWNIEEDIVDIPLVANAKIVLSTAHLTPLDQEYVAKFGDYSIGSQ